MPEPMYMLYYIEWGKKVADGIKVACCKSQKDSGRREHLYDYPHFIERETEAPRGWEICLKPHS